MDRDDHGIGLRDRRDLTPSGSGRSDRCFDWFISICERSSSMNSGRSFGRQEISTSAMQVRHDAALALHARGRGLALEVDRDVDADLLRLQDALQVDVHDGVARRVQLQILDDRGLGHVADLRG